MPCFHFEKWPPPNPTYKFLYPPLRADTTDSEYKPIDLLLLFQVLQMKSSITLTKNIREQFLSGWHGSKWLSISFSLNALIHHGVQAAPSGFLNKEAHSL